MRGLNKLSEMRFLMIIISFAFVGSAQLRAQVGSRIHGNIDLPSFDKWLQKSKLYNADGSPVMCSSDPLAQQKSNVIISMHPMDFEPALEPTVDAVITQQQQTFIPNVLPVTKGSTVYLLNEDEFFHNIYSLTPGARFNIGRRPPGNPYAVVIKKLGAVKLFCDIHSHMGATILSLDTPYFTRISNDRSFSIDGLPDGEYEMQIYHPLLSLYRKSVRIEGGRTIELDVDLSQIDVK